MDIEHNEAPSEVEDYFQKLKDPIKVIENTSQTSVSAKSIEKVTKRLKKSTGGGRQQITPWMISSGEQHKRLMCIIHFKPIKQDG